MTVYVALKKIHDLCENTADCNDCPLGVVDYGECGIHKLALITSESPVDWDMERIKEILDD